jgi:hypothetical protein
LNNAIALSLVLLAGLFGGSYSFFVLSTSSYLFKLLFGLLLLSEFELAFGYLRIDR